MNWTTVGYIKNHSTARKAALADEDSACEHVENDPACASHIHREKDSCGTVGSYVCCEECHAKIEEREEEEIVTCYDCKNDYPTKNTISWKWYDFYAPQGDEPLIICDSCRTKPKHIERVKKDQADYEAEFPEDEDT